MHIVSISSLKGGVGKTSVTLGLASAALHAGMRTLVVDLDPHADATTGLGVSLSQHRDIGRLLKAGKRAVLSEHVASSSWALGEGARPKGTLDVAAGSAFSGVYDRPDLSRRDLRRLSVVLGSLDPQAYDLVFIDSPPSLNGLTRIGWVSADHILLVTEPGLFSVAGTERTLRAIELFRQDYGTEVSAVGIIANRVRSQSPEHEYRLKEMGDMFNSLLWKPTLAEYPQWQQIQGAAQSVHGWAERSAEDVAKNFDQLLSKLRKVGGESRRTKKRENR